MNKQTYTTSSEFKKLQPVADHKNKPFSYSNNNLKNVDIQTVAGPL